MYRAALFLCLGVSFVFGDRTLIRHKRQDDKSAAEAVAEATAAVAAAALAAPPPKPAVTLTGALGTQTTGLTGAAINDFYTQCMSKCGKECHQTCSKIANQLRTGTLPGFPQTGTQWGANAQTGGINFAQGSAITGLAAPTSFAAPTSQFSAGSGFLQTAQSAGKPLSFSTAPAVPNLASLPKNVDLTLYNRFVSGNPAFGKPASLTTQTATAPNQFAAQWAAATQQLPGQTAQWAAAQQFPGQTAQWAAAQQFPGQTAQWATAQQFPGQTAQWAAATPQLAAQTGGLEQTFQFPGYPRAYPGAYANALQGLAAPPQLSSSLNGFSQYPYNAASQYAGLSMPGRAPYGSNGAAGAWNALSGYGAYGAAGQQYGNLYGWANGLNGLTGLGQYGRKPWFLKRR